MRQGQGTVPASTVKSCVLRTQYDTNWAQSLEVEDGTLTGGTENDTGKDPSIDHPPIRPAARNETVHKSGPEVPA